MRGTTRLGLLGLLAGGLLVFTTGCSSGRGHCLGYSTGAGAPGYSYGYGNYGYRPVHAHGYGCGHGHSFRPSRFRRRHHRRGWGRRYRRRPGVSLGFHLD